VNFNRACIISISILLVIAGMTVPLSFALYLSWIQAKDYERDKLFTNAKRAIQRSRVCIDEVYQALDSLEDLQSTSCTPALMQKMQDVAFNKRCINEIEYLENGTVKCSSEGSVSGNVKFPSGDFVMPNEAILSFDTSAFVKRGGQFLSFERNNFAISVDTDPLSDVIVEPYVKIAIITQDGQVISTLNYSHPDMGLINAALKNPNLKQTDNSLVAIYRTPALTYIVSESISYAFVQWRKNLVLFVPFGLIMSFIACSAVIWGLRRRLSNLGELKLAIINREFVLYYQPIIEFKTGLCKGAEALIRWQKQDGTIVRPDLFIPLAEENGLIQAITDQVIESIVTDLKATLQANRDLHIAINIAVVDFNTKRIFKKLDSTISESGIEPQQIWLEITERGFMDINSTRDSLNRARELGYPIVIDDFGTGYSSLSYLKELPIDVLKIDKSFTSSVDTDSVTNHVTKHIIDIAKELKLKIIAEGVETKGQADYLKSHEVDFAQGWLYAKAMPLHEFLSFFQNNASKNKD